MYLVVDKVFEKQIFEYIPFTFLLLNVHFYFLLLFKYFNEFLFECNFIFVFESSICTMNHIVLDTWNISKTARNTNTPTLDYKCKNKNAFFL